MNVERDLRLLACQFAEDVLPLFEAKYPHDRRPRQAIETARRYVMGGATMRELNAAREAAWEVAWGAAGEVAGEAARKRYHQWANEALLAALEEKELK